MRPRQLVLTSSYLPSGCRIAYPTYMQWGILVRTAMTFGATLFVASAACSSEESGTGAGGAAASSTSTASTGGSDGGTGGEGGMEAECPHTGEPVFDPASLQTCEGFDTCRCVPTVLVPPDNVDDLADCDANNKCVPDLLVETGGNFIPKTCASIAGFEGRCLSECLPAVASQVDRLPQDVCDPGERCAPCYDPFDQTATGACAQSCDPGPVDPPGSFTACCSDRGSCVPSSSLSPDDASNLGQDSCTAASELCVPNGIATGTFVAEPCEPSIIGLGGAQYKAGACLHDCLPAVDNFAIFQDTCAAGFKCAPCLDPTNNGAPTGACDYLAQ